MENFFFLDFLENYNATTSVYINLKKKIIMTYALNNSFFVPFFLYIMKILLIIFIIII